MAAENVADGKCPTGKWYKKCFRFPGKKLTCCMRTPWKFPPPIDRNWRWLPVTVWSHSSRFRRGKWRHIWARVWWTSGGPSYASCPWEFPARFGAYFGQQISEHQSLGAVWSTRGLAATFVLLALVAVGDRRCRHISTDRALPASLNFSRFRCLAWDSRFFVNESLKHCGIDLKLCDWLTFLFK